MCCCFVPSLGLCLVLPLKPVTDQGTSRQRGHKEMRHARNVHYCSNISSNNYFDTTVS